MAQNVNPTTSRLHEAQEKDSASRSKYLPYIFQQIYAIKRFD